jgi:hypothetical protein
MQQRGIKLFGRQRTVIFSHREKKEFYLNNQCVRLARV